MARKTVRVDVPSSCPDDLIVLAQKILAKNTSDGTKSPLPAEKIAALQAATTAADTTNASAKDFDAQAQAARQQRDQSLGVADGQTAYTAGTVLNLVTYVRDMLLLTMEGNEEGLSAYGFNVVVGSAKTPQRETKPQAAATT